MNFTYDSADNRKKLLFQNGYTRHLCNTNDSDLPYYAKYISSKNEMVYRDEELNIVIYDMNDFSFPEITEQVLLYSMNNFEESKAHWQQQNSDLTEEVKYDGEKSIEVREFSSTFQFALDSLDMQGVSRLLVSGKLFCHFDEKTNSTLVVSIENQDGTYIWKAKEVNKYLKAYSNWWPIHYQVRVTKEELKGASTLKIFLWNKTKKKAYIDNFEVKIIGIKD